MLNSLRAKTAADQSVVTTTTEVNRIAVVAQNEENQQNLDIDVNAQNWDMELFQQGANVLSAIHGSVIPTAGKTSRVTSAIGGAMGGASAGAALGGEIGAAGGPFGLVGGAAIGTIAGALGGAFA